MRKKSTKDKLVEEFKKREWGRDKKTDDDLLDILFDLIESEKPPKRTRKKKALS